MKSVYILTGKHIKDDKPVIIAVFDNFLKATSYEMEIKKSNSDISCLHVETWEIKE